MMLPSLLAAMRPTADVAPRLPRVVAQDQLSAAGEVANTHSLLHKPFVNIRKFGKRAELTRLHH